MNHIMNHILYHKLWYKNCPGNSKIFDLKPAEITFKENIIKEFHLNQVYQKANGQKKND